MASTLLLFGSLREISRGAAGGRATTQAERQHYVAPYLAAGKPVWIIGLSFASKTHELIDHCVERFA